MAILGKIGGKANEMMAGAQDTMDSINDAIFPHPGQVTQSLFKNPNFGGSNRGFAQGVAEAVASTFYAETSEADGLSIPLGMQGQAIPRSIANQYALFNFKGFRRGLKTNQYQKGDYYNSTGKSVRHYASNITMKKLV